MGGQDVRGSAMDRILYQVASGRLACLLGFAVRTDTRIPLADRQVDTMIHYNLRDLVLAASSLANAYCERTGVQRGIGSSSLRAGVVQLASAHHFRRGSCSTGATTPDTDRRDETG